MLVFFPPLHHFSICTVGNMEWIVSMPERLRHWLVVEGLESGKLYEFRVVASNGDEGDALETTSPVKWVQIGMKRGW